MSDSNQNLFLGQLETTHNDLRSSTDQTSCSETKMTSEIIMAAASTTWSTAELRPTCTSINLTSFELWPTQLWAVTNSLNCDQDNFELWPRQLWAVTNTTLNCDQHNFELWTTQLYYNIELWPTQLTLFAEKHWTVTNTNSTWHLTVAKGTLMTLNCDQQNPIDIKP